MREWLKSMYIAGASAVKRPQTGIYIMNGHFLSRRTNNDASVFTGLLGELSKFARFIDIQSAADLVLNGDTQNIDETLIAFTFDDGFDDNILALAPALEKFNTNACCFINPGFIDGDGEYIHHFTQHVVQTPGKQPMTWTQVKQLHERGFVIGNHTKDHVRLSSVPLAEAERQVRESKVLIESVTGVPCEHFAWPYGQYADVNDAVVAMLGRYHHYVYSGCDYKRYTSFDRKVLNRRHFEADWPHHMVKFFLSSKRVA